MRDTEYAFAVAYIKTIANKMLSQKDLEQLLSFDSTDAAIKFLKDRGFGGATFGTERIEELLQQELEAAWQVAYEVLPEGAPIDLLLYQNDFHNLKTILKAVLSSEPWENLILRPCLVEPDVLYQAVMQKEFSELPEFIRELSKDAYELITTSNDGQLAELLIDKNGFFIMKQRARGNAFLEGWVELNISIANLKLAVRGAQMKKSLRFLQEAVVSSETMPVDQLVHAAAEGLGSVLSFMEEQGYPEAVQLLRQSMSAFEKWCDNQRMEYIKKYKNSSFGVEPIVAFLIGKQVEIQAVRIIISGKENRIPTEIIRERLREMYV